MTMARRLMTGGEYKELCIKNELYTAINHYIFNARTLFDMISVNNSKQPNDGNYDIVGAYISYCTYVCINKTGHVISTMVNRVL